MILVISGKMPSSSDTRTGPSPFSGRSPDFSRTALLFSEEFPSSRRGAILKLRSTSPDILPEKTIVDSLRYGGIPVNTGRPDTLKKTFPLIAGETSGFISPLGFLSMHLFQGAGWILFFRIFEQREPFGTPVFFAMLHAFGLGFLTLAAFSVLVHVLPAAAGLPVGKSVGDRVPVWGIGFGAILFVTGWLVPDLRLSLVGGAVILLSAGYFFGRVLKEIAFPKGRPPRKDGGLGILITVALSFLVTGIILGLWMLSALLYPSNGFVLARIPVVHALSMIGGWLTLLVMAVFLRTSGPLLGHPVATPRSVFAWSLAGTGVLLGITGLLFDTRFLTGFGLLAGISGLVLYGRPVITAFRNARPMNPLPLWFLGSAVSWLLLGMALLFRSFLTRSPNLPGLLMVFLIGWLGQFFLAHLYHLGPRLIGILRNGPQDMTPPFALLARTRSRTTFSLYQAGIALGMVPFFFPETLPGEFRSIGPALGFLAWISLSLEIRSAWKKAGKIPRSEERIFLPSSHKKP